jgi:hypothetical protein
MRPTGEPAVIVAIVGAKNHEIAAIFPPTDRRRADQLRLQRTEVDFSIGILQFGVASVAFLQRGQGERFRGLRNIDYLTHDAGLRAQYSVRPKIP